MQKRSAVKTRRAPAKAKKAARKSRQGGHYVCSTCGMEVTVDNDCGCAETSELICCGKAMRQRK